MTRRELLATLEEGLQNGRISPQTAAYIAAEVLNVEAYDTGYQEWDGFSNTVVERSALADLETVVVA